jgi:hypothetical protein
MKASIKDDSRTMAIEAMSSAAFSVALALKSALKSTHSYDRKLVKVELQVAIAELDLALRLLK